MSSDLNARIRAAQIAAGERVVMEDLARKEGRTWPPFVPTHRHYKGGLYAVLHLGKLEADLSDVVIYQAADGSVWVRPVDDFYASVPDGRRRFEPLEAQP